MRVLVKVPSSEDGVCTGTQTLRPTSPWRFLKARGFLELPRSSTPGKETAVILGGKDVWHLHPHFMTEDITENLSGFHQSSERTRKQRRDKRAIHTARTSEVATPPRKELELWTTQGCPPFTQSSLTEWVRLA